MIKLISVLAVAGMCGAADTGYLAADLPVQNLVFFETFDEKTGGLFTSKKWIKSTLPKYKNQPAMVKRALNAAPGFEEDKGLQLTQEMKHYGLSSMLNKPFAPTGDAVFQYEVKFDSFTCGGAYLKFLRQSDGLDLSQLSDSTPFTVMFGPDKCGSNNKVHFILQHQNPISGEWEEKHFAKAPRVVSDKSTHLYTLAIHGADNSFEIYIDKKKAAQGNLHKDMEPPINAPIEIDDPAEVKPEDWVDEPSIPDPDAVKPDDWDETVPMMIPDLSVQMPLGWEESWPELVADPSAFMPEGWDDEEDGQWEAPLVPNPDCEAVPGCGPWKPPMKKNPEYRGKWVPPIIDNPAYIGEWAPKKIPNPNYFEDPHPSRLAPIGAVAIEVWTTNPGFHYDNIIVAKNLDDAWAFADASFVKKQDAEEKKQEEDVAVKLAESERQRMLSGGFKEVVAVYVQKFVTYVAGNRHMTEFFDRVLKFAVDSGITDTGIISMHHLQIIEENATSIIIGFTLVVLIMSLFVCCACVLPAGKVISKSHDEEDSPPGPEQGSPTSGNDADSEAEVNDNDEGRAKDSTGLRQRKVTSTGSKLSPAGKKKPRKDD